MFAAAAMRWRVDIESGGLRHLRDFDTKQIISLVRVYQRAPSI